MGDWTDLLPRPGQGSGIPEAILAQQQGRAQIGQQNAATQVLGAQLQGIQAKAAQDQAYQRDVAGYLAITDPKKQTTALSDLMAKYPDKANDLSKSWGLKDQAAKSADLGWMGETVAAFDANRPELARANIQRRLEADKAAGLDTTNDESWLAAIDSKDPKAIAYVRGAMLAHIGAADPQRFSQNYETAAKAGSPFNRSPGQETVDPITNTVTGKTAFAPRVIKVVRDGVTYYEEYQPGGGDSVSDGTGTAPSPSPSYTGGPVTVDALKPLFSAQESGGSYTARNPDTGAMGRWQVMPGTGAKLAKKIGLDWRPDMMLHDTPEDRQYQDKIGDAAMAEAVAVAKGDPAKAFSYYYSGSTSAYKNPQGNPKTARYVSDMMTRLAGGDPRAKGTPAGSGPLRTLTTGDAPGASSNNGQPNGGATDDAVEADAQAMIQNGYKMPTGSARNPGYVTAVRNRAAALLKEQGLSVQDAMRGGQDFKAAQVMISGMAQTKPGTPGGIVRSGNVGLDHMAQLKQAFLALQTGNVQVFNRISQWWQRNTGSPLPTNAAAIGGIVSGEMTKMVIGSAGALADREDLHAQLQNMNSPAQGIGVIDQFASLAGAQLQGLRRQYEATTGRKDFVKYLSPRAARLIGAGGSAAPVKVKTLQEAMALPKGTHFIDPYGRPKIR